MNLAQTGPVPIGRSLRRAALKQVGPVFRIALTTQERLAQRGQVLSWGISLIALAVAVFFPLERLPVGRAQSQLNADSLNAALIGLWTVEATLFVLTAAITALLIGLFTEPAARMELMARYRRNAFDAAALIALFALLYTGALIAVVLGAETVKGWHIGHWVIAAGAVFIVDLGELAWLLLYTHRLLSEPPESQTLRWTLALRTSFLEEVVARMARMQLAAWAAARYVGYEDFGSASGQGRAALVADRTAYVHDVRLRRLDAWLANARRATAARRWRWALWDNKPVPDPNARQPSVRIYLNVRATRGTRLAWVDGRAVPTASKLVQALTWRSHPPPDPFPDALNQIRDRAGAAARDGQAGALDQVLDGLESIYDEAMRIEAGLVRLPNPPIPRLFGWQPRTQLRIALQRLGVEVSDSESVFVVNQWLYFVQQLLRALRPYTGMNQEIMELWVIAGTRPDPPQQLMLRLSEYVAELNLAWREATSNEDVLRRLAESLDFVRCIRSIWAYGIDQSRPRLRETLAAVDDFVDPLPAGIAPTPLDQSRREAQQAIQTASRYFWFGAGVWLTHAAATGKVSSAEFSRIWDEDIAPSFQRPEQVWEAWGDYASTDVIGWAQLRAHEEHSAIMAAGNRGIFIADDMGVAAAPALALLLEHTNFGGMRATPADGQRFQAYMQAAPQVLFGSTTIPWPQIQVHLPMTETATRFQALRDAVLH